MLIGDHFNVFIVVGIMLWFAGPLSRAFVRRKLRAAGFPLKRVSTLSGDIANGKLYYRSALAPESRLPLFLWSGCLVPGLVILIGHVLSKLPDRSEHRVSPSTTIAFKLEIRFGGGTFD
jgi:hypothetical protein